jgi:D-3-phosphoglycerate dehydrogenase/C-terminal binding protein|tara:strand:- start:7367 stop:8371 length:1005 start_codon:yes stop_codon:yes gene_type:complete
MNILITDLHVKENEVLEKIVAGDDNNIEFFKHQSDVTDQAWESADAIITYRGAQTVMSSIDKIKNTKVIIRGGVGFDGLDLIELGKRGIAVFNVPDYGTTEVADHAISLMLMMRRGLDQYQDKMKQSPTTNWKYIEGPCVDRIRGKTFGVFGLGRIGNATAKRAQAFDMDIVFYDPYLPDGIDISLGYKRVNTPEELFSLSDTISIHCLLNDETRNLIDKKLFSKAKKSLLIINTARGPIINLDDLYAALKENMISGAALDVLPQEPPTSLHPLLKAYVNEEQWLSGKFTLTPHVAFYSPPGLEDLRSKAVRTAISYINNQNLRNCQNIEYLKA